jgi:cell division protease FtsH
MSDEVGMVQLTARGNPYLGIDAGTQPFSEATARIVDHEVHRIISECHAQAVALLRQHRAQLDALVAALLVRETLDEQEVLEVTELPPAPQLESGRISAAVAEPVALAKMSATPKP